MTPRNGPKRPSVVVLASMLLSLLLLLSACGGGDDETNGDASSSGKPSGSLVVALPGGSLSQAVNAAYLQPFENETGVNVEGVEAGDNPVAAIKPQVESGNVLWDLVACPLDAVVAFPELWETIDSSKVKSLDKLNYDLDPELAKRFAVLNLQSFLMAYSTEEFPDDPPRTWADFFDVKKFPGPRGVPDVGLESATYVPMAALLADGVSAEDLLPLDLDRAYAKLDELRPNIRVFYTSFGQSQDILRAGEVVINFMTDGRAGTLTANGEAVAASFDQALTVLGGFCIPKGAKNKDNALALYEYLLSHPKQQGVFASLTAYGPPTDAGADAAKQLGVKDFTSLHLDEMVPQSAELLKYIQKNSDMLLNRWNDWVQSG
ncbi:MAG TPA: ABC transporter substrate-binding protein [Thermoleophilaceae bacterium]|nr:ABC transporter substrate-binding protein [Thermoleophilaceae bacterium]